MIELGNDIVNHQELSRAHWKPNSLKYRDAPPSTSWKSTARRLLRFGQQHRNSRTNAPTSDEPAFHNEEHHRVYGAPWCLGRDQYNHLIQSGLPKDGKVLDFGCGSLRLGIWLIPYLNHECYYGIDAHYPSLDAAENYEIPLHGLQSRKPRLLLSADCEIHQFNTKFDTVVAMSVFHHMTDEQQNRAVTNIVTHSTENLVIHAVGFTMHDSDLAKHGLKRLTRTPVRCSLSGATLDWQTITKH